MERFERKRLYQNGLFHVEDMERCPVRMAGGSVMTSLPVVIEDMERWRIIVFGDIDMLIDDTTASGLVRAGEDAIADYVLDNAHVIVNGYGMIYRCGVMHNEMTVSMDKMEEILKCDDLERLVLRKSRKTVQFQFPKFWKWSWNAAMRLFRR